jgi:hypothetical protein
LTRQTIQDFFNIKGTPRHGLHMLALSTPMVISYKNDGPKSSATSQCLWDFNVQMLAGMTILVVKLTICFG